MRKREEISKERKVILEILRQNGGELQLSDLSEKFRGMARAGSRKTIFKRLSELEDIGSVVKYKRGANMVVGLAEGQDIAKSLTRSVELWHRLLQNTKNNIDKVPPDKRGSILGSLIVALTCYKNMTSLYLLSTESQYLPLIKHTIEGFDSSINETIAFVLEKCKEDAKVAAGMMYEFKEVAHTAIDNIGKYVDTERKAKQQKERKKPGKRKG